MGKVLAIGEAFIDFIEDHDQQPPHYIPHFGGAPANVALAVKALGTKSQLIAQVGNDVFGHLIEKRLEAVGVDTCSLLKTDAANTALAFVSITQEKERDFTFYRSDTADLLLSDRSLDERWFQADDILHFCSVSLVAAPCKKAHEKAIELMRKKGGLISFDVNVRLALWPDKKALKVAILEFMEQTDILKLSLEELHFLTDIKNEKDAVNHLFRGTIKVILISKGKDGATVYTKTGIIDMPGVNVKTVDTTGAGDVFIASILKQILNRGHHIEAYEPEDWRHILKYANTVAALTTTKKGATEALYDAALLKEYLDQ